MGTSEQGLSKLAVATRVFLPAHGVAFVRANEERDFGGAPQQFFVLELSRGKKLMVPEHKVEHLGARKLVSAAKARKLLASLRMPVDPDSLSPWKARAASHADGLRTGCPDRYTEILRELLCRARVASLSASDSRALQTARGYFVAEISAALDKPADEIDAAVSAATG